MGKAKELATQSITLSKSVDESFKQSQNSLAIEKFKTISVVSNSSISSEAGRSFSWPIMIVCILLFWPAAIVYYFMCAKNSITLTFTSNEGAASTVTITANGKKAIVVSEHLRDILK